MRRIKELNGQSQGYSAGLGQAELADCEVVSDLLGDRIGSERPTSPPKLAPPASIERIARFEELGEDHVRELVEQWCWPLSTQGRAWLKTKHEAANRQDETIKLEQAAVMRRAAQLALLAGATAGAVLVGSISAWLSARFSASRREDLP